MTPQPMLTQARTLYVLQEQIDGPRHTDDPTARMLAQNPTTPKLSKDVELWIIYRTHTLDWNDKIFTLLLSQLSKVLQHG